MLAPLASSVAAMIPRAAALSLVLAGWTAFATPAAALMIGGGGSPRTDCLVALDAPANSPAAKPRNVRCTDGDPSCDADGAVNGACEFPLAVCANSTFSARCTLAGVQSIAVEHAADNGDPEFDPEFQALQTRISNELAPPTVAADLCAGATNFHVRVDGPIDGRCRKTAKTVKLRTLSQVIDGQIHADKDKIKLTCEPAPTGCDAQALFDGTFDRIQRQIFDRSCAVSGCHDSQTHMAGLLLETGASLGNLIDVTPTNAAAATAGWKRVTVLGAGSGDPDTSLLFHKVAGPPPGFGAQMPFERRRLDSSLVEVIRSWIAAGAPETGWVPGTD